MQEARVIITTLDDLGEELKMNYEEHVVRLTCFC